MQPVRSNTDAITEVSLRGVRFLARHCEPLIDSGAKQSHLFSVRFLRKHLARNRLRNLEVKDKIATLLPLTRESLAMTIVLIINVHVLVHETDQYNKQCSLKSNITIFEKLFMG
jgi:hypothetical protein